jgi:tetratricopeptide (TPR) repeat protein
MKSLLPDSESIQKALIKDASSVAQMFFRRGIEFEAQGNLLLAIDDYSTALRISPNDPLVLLRRGMAFDRKGDLDRAIENFNEALRINQAYSDALIARASVWRKKRQFDRAQKDQDAALKIDEADQCEIIFPSMVASIA